MPQYSIIKYLTDVFAILPHTVELEDLIFRFVLWMAGSVITLLFVFFIVALNSTLKFIYFILFLEIHVNYNCSW